MDGRDRLRRYLEQRREAGERDLVLDTLTVADVMRIVGAQGRGLARRDALSSTDRPTPAGDAAGLPPTSDWRAVLAAADRDVPLPRVTEPAPPPPPAAPSRATATPSPRPGPASVTPPTGAPIVTSADGSASAPRWPAGIEIGQAASELFAGPLAALQSLADLDHAVAGCTRCPLYATATRPVPGEGSATAGLVCVGEAPGATEDATGRPFVGQAGKLLDKILAAIALAREDVFICNVLKHRPPGNRNPLPTEVSACSPYLVRQLELIRPRVIVAFGTFAAQTLLQTTQPIGKLRGAVHRYYGVPLIVTYHPAALLRNPAWKRPTWEDVQYARRILDGTGL